MESEICCCFVVRMINIDLLNCLKCERIYLNLKCESILIDYENGNRLKRILNYNFVDLPITDHLCIVRFKIRKIHPSTNGDRRRSPYLK